MTFWQENYGFVREVYDYRCAKYLEWMDNIEAIIGKVMANTQYTAKEFKIIKDTFTSLCRDLDKENTKSWLDMMLEKLASHKGMDEDGATGRDKALKMQEKKKLEALMERHNSLMKPTYEAQSKVDHYSECYAFGDDIHPVMKVLNEQMHLSTKEIHPHNMEMCEEQIDKQEKVIRTVENVRATYLELKKRGEKLKSNPNAPEFLEKEIKRLDDQWQDTNVKAHVRLKLINATYKDWETYETDRVNIYKPLDDCEEEFKKYKKIYDPDKGARVLEKRKQRFEVMKMKIIDIYGIIKRCFVTIADMAGDDKKDFIEKDVKEIEERKQIIEKCEKSLADLTDFNVRLRKFVETLAELRKWMEPAVEKLKFITGSADLSPEDRVKEIFDLQNAVNERLPMLEPLDKECHELLDVPENEEGQTNEVALGHLNEFCLIKETITDLNDKVEIEAGSITEDQKHYADYLHGVKEFKPWMDKAEGASKEVLPKPPNLLEATKLLETVTAFQTDCAEHKTKLDSAADSRSKMEKVTKADNDVETLQTRWDLVKGIADERVTRIQNLVDTWSKLSAITEGLTTSLAGIPNSEDPKVDELEGVFKEFKEINSTKLKLLSEVQN